MCQVNVTRRMIPATSLQPNSTLTLILSANGTDLAPLVGKQLDPFAFFITSPSVIAIIFKFNAKMIMTKELRAPHKEMFF